MPTGQVETNEATTTIPSRVFSMSKPTRMYGNSLLSSALEIWICIKIHTTINTFTGEVV